MKPWYKSKTILFNLAAALAAFVASTLPQVQEHMTPQNFVLFSSGVGVANVFLRFITSQPLSTDKE